MTDKHAFQAETKSLLRLMIHSLYSNKEIFLRELISNASDACDKLRFEAISRPELMGTDELAVEIIPDKAAGTLTIRDNGIGMTREDMVAHLGTIARSGTREFMSKLSGDQAKDAQLIGQFGVGFYSSFIVADDVTVRSRRAGTDEATEWSSKGEGEFEVQPCEKATSGTDVILKVREDDKEFLEASRLSFIVRKYSDHIGLPIRIRDDKGELETLNQARAFWTRPKSELKDEDYQAFYKHLAHDFEEPLSWAHHKVEGNLEYTSLIYIPRRASFELWNREAHQGLHLYVKRVFIMDKAAELLPPYLRFVRGLVDTADLPLNVSREILQGSRTTEKIKAALVKRVLDLLDDMAEKKPEDYKVFWNTFGSVLKEGVVEDTANSERIAKLLRMASTKDPAGELTSLPEYVKRMTEAQKSIYFLTTESLTAARSSPHLEGFAKRGLEVLLLTDRIDEWVVSNLTQFDGKPLKSVAQGAAELDDVVETAEQAQQESSFKDVFERVKAVLEDRVQEVQLSKRLTDSPSCLVAPDFGMSRRLEKMLAQGGEKIPRSKAILELNGDHPLVARLKETNDDAVFADFAELLYGQAQLAEGGQLDDPGAFVKRLNRLVLGQAPSGRIIV
ncbi:molecular chaperone HtpG [Panacagrimonas perspica]|uniref:Chaperone protein HtpG n=1 Tax=Panacagrimonas perspica TaxID=381431 RepID=A0A4R7PAM5_9GAMM|nr:molecular chaperone HtpG [Panacagrimonas perspica]TDU31105.1 molecular chaperone HtpG [Panacagrimonas perspica]THD01758.1 molecular chaperone HtpG [Panacagrimonas perspica]